MRPRLSVGKMRIVLYEPPPILIGEYPRLH
jgi:hypothetical protein